MLLHVIRRPKKYPIFAAKVKRWTSIFLLSIYLFGTTEAYQALKLPMLIEHYVKHKHENPRLTLIGFLKLHYSGKTVFDADYQQDMRLPFKTQDNAGVSSMANDLPAPMGFEVGVPVALSGDYLILNIHLDFSPFPPSIFQPPRA